MHPWVGQDKSVVFARKASQVYWATVGQWLSPLTLMLCLMFLNQHARIFKIFHVKEDCILCACSSLCGCWQFWAYSLHQKKVYTCGKAKYSKSRGARGKVGGRQHPPLSWSKLKMRLGPVWTNSMVGLAHLLLFILPPSVLSTRLDKSVYFLLGETVIQLTVKNTPWNALLHHWGHF